MPNSNMGELEEQKIWCIYSKNLEIGIQHLWLNDSGGIAEGFHDCLVDTLPKICEIIHKTTCKDVEFNRIDHKWVRCAIMHPKALSLVIDYE